MATTRSSRASVEQWLAAFLAKRPPPVGTPRITYLDEISVSCDEFANLMKVTAASNAELRAGLADAIDSGDVMSAACRTWLSFDRDTSGFLEWDNGEIKDFVKSFVCWVRPHAALIEPHL